MCRILLLGVDEVKDDVEGVGEANCGSILTNILLNFKESPLSAS
jgi:hypothetical protein